MENGFRPIVTIFFVLTNPALRKCSGIHSPPQRGHGIDKDKAEVAEVVKLLKLRFPIKTSVPDGTAREDVALVGASTAYSR